MGSSICQKPDANEINGAAKIIRLLIRMTIIGHQSITIQLWKKAGHSEKG